MNSLIANKLHRLKGEPVEEIIDNDVVILNDDQAKLHLTSNCQNWIHSKENKRDE